MVSRHDRGGGSTSLARGYFARRADENIQITIVAVIAIFAIVIAISIATFSSHQITFPESILVALAAFALVSIVAAAIAQFFRDQQPSAAAEQAAIARIHTSVDSLLSRYGMDQPVIDPPVKFLDTPDQRNQKKLESLLEDTESTSIDAFMAQAARSAKVTLILGDYGSGKTSLLLKLTKRILNDSKSGNLDLIPLFFKSKDWSEEYGSFHQWIVASAFESYRIPTDIADYWIRKGKLFVALDGLHEVLPERYDRFCIEIRRWAEAASGTRMAISASFSVATAQTLAGKIRVDQLCVLQPLPAVDFQRYLQEILSRLSIDSDRERIEQMDQSVIRLFDQREYLRGPALVGLLGEALVETRQLPGSHENPADDDDPALVAFQIANDFFNDRDYSAAIKAYTAITNMPRSRWHTSAYTLLGTCFYMTGDTQRANDAILESVSLRLQQSIQANPNEIEALSDVELKCLDAIPVNTSYDIAQIGSAAGLPISQARDALRVLRERGLVETVEETEERPRFRRSIASMISQ